MFTFPYRIKRIEEGILVDPRVELFLKTKKGFTLVKFLLDSGADVTTLSYDPYAKLFNFQKEKAQRITIGGVEGKGVGAYPHTITARLGKIEFSLRIFFIESFVDPLLGRLDFWDKFSITFDNKNRQTIIIPL